MKNYWIIPIVAILFIGLTFVSGCQQKTTDQTGTAFVGGSEGLEVSFVSGAPPSEVFEKNGFTLSVNVENKGESDVQDAVVYIGGIDGSAFGLSATSQTVPPLRGVSNPGGTILPGIPQIVSFTSSGYQFDIPGDTQFTAIAKVCYPYLTQAVATACIANPNIVQQSVGTEVCKIGGEIDSESSGGPVQITGISEVPGSNSLGFILNLENVGGGIPYNANTCENLAFDKLNKIASVSATLRGIELECSTNDPTTTAATDIPLGDNKATVYCTYALPEGTSTVTTDLLTVKVNYYYFNEAQTKFTVRNIG